MSGDDLSRAIAGDLEIAYRDVGAGPPMILFHGAEGDHRVHNAVQDLLAEDFRVLSFDQRDCGGTRFVGEPPASYTLTDVAADSIRLLDALGYERAAFVGFSLGGLLAQYAAASWPQRIDRLVLGVTWPGDTRLQDLHPEGRATRARLSEQGEAGRRQLAEFMSTPRFVADHPEIVEALRDLSKTPSEAGRTRRFAALAAAEPIDLAPLRQRTLVISAAMDQLVPPALGVLLASKLASARLEIIPEAGHLATRQAPQLIAGLIKEFLHAR